MGSSKKHKKDKDSSSSSSKKHKHKDKLRSPPPPPDARIFGNGSQHARADSAEEREAMRERERDRERRHKKHKSRKHKQRSRSPNDVRRTSKGTAGKDDYHSDSSDVVEVPMAPPAPVISKPSRSPTPDGGAGDCLSVAETNKLRAKLGLKPLETNTEAATTESGGQKKNAEGQAMLKDEWGEFFHKPADNLAEKIQAEKLREKFRQKKEKRLLDEKLKKVKGLGESEDFDDINAWIDRSREKEKLKAEAEKRAKALEEMDAEFGVSDLIQQDMRDSKRRVYSDRNLHGLKVDHEIDSFGEGKTVILTLKDHDVLAEDEDTLVNVNMIDDERYKKNIENRKQKPNHYGYDVYEEQFDRFGDPIERNILSKYDDEIGENGVPLGGKRKAFKIGEDLAEELSQKRRLLEIKTKLAGKRLETLDDSMLSLASDTYTEDEMSKFKKPKRKVKKLRQKLKAEDLLPLPGQQGSARDFGKRHRPNDGIIDTDDVPQVDDDQSGINVEEEDDDLQQILSKARRLKQKEALITKTLGTAFKSEIKSEKGSNDEGDDEDQHVDGDVDMSAKDNNIILNATAEFCRTLGDIPTYGMSGNRDEDAGDMMDFEYEHNDAEEPREEERSTGTWNSVNPNLEIVSEDKSNEMTEVAILDEEPDVGSGMGAALKLALSKGYLEKEETNRPSNTRMAHLQAKNYSIEDKAYAEDEKFQRRDRYHSGPITDFKEKDMYRPNVKLEYIDDNGRLLNEKEAFRYLSHKFHGKGPGKNKIEKRLKKNEQDGLMMKMSSTDTPLGTLTMLQHKQKETHSPYIVLSGSKQTHASTSITKNK